MINLTQIIEQESKTLKTKKTIENINESLYRILFEDKKVLTRIELNQVITEYRINELYTSEQLSSMNQEKVQKLVQKTLKTVKNGLDTSISRSNNNSSFHYNQKYKDYTLSKDKNNKFSITKNKK